MSRDRSYLVHFVTTGQGLIYNRLLIISPRYFATRTDAFVAGAARRMPRPRAASLRVRRALGTLPAFCWLARRRDRGIVGRLARQPTGEAVRASAGLRPGD